MAGTLRGQEQAVHAVINQGDPLVVGAGLDSDIAFRLAKALNESSGHHAICEDIFYSPRHAGETGAPLHPGAARYYRNIDAPVAREGET